MKTRRDFWPLLADQVIFGRVE